MKNLLLIGLVAAGLWIMTKVRAATSLSFIPKGVTFDGLGLNLILAVQNTSPFPVSFQYFTGTVSANGVPLGNVLDQQPVTIVGDGVTEVKLQLVPSFDNIVQLIKNIFSSTSPQSIQLDGEVYAENLSFPVKTIFTTIPSLA